MHEIEYQWVRQGSDGVALSAVSHPPCSALLAANDPGGNILLFNCETKSVVLKIFWSTCVSQNKVLRELCAGSTAMIVYAIP